MCARRRRNQPDLLTGAEARLAADLLQSALKTPLGRRALIIVVIVAVVCVGGWWVWEHHLRPHHPVGPTVRIATWNLRQFSESRKGTDLRAIADIIRDSKFDIVAIQEIKKNGEEVDRLLNVLGSPWKSTSFSDITGNYERFAFIYDSDHVQLVGTAYSIATIDAVIFDRIPYQQTFRAGQFDFTLITCHLYYGEGTNGYARRAREVATLANFARNYALKSPEKDIIVLGDFNETRGHENIPSTFFANGWQACNSDATNLGGNEVYDQILIDAKFTREWAGTGGAIHFDEMKFGNNDKTALERVSDHRPAYADFVTNLPDDD